MKNTVNDKRPVNLDIATLELPLAAIASISHRISGVALFAAVGVFLYLLDASLASEQSFNEIKVCLDSIVVKCVLWVCVAALIYHSVAGIKHLFADVGVGETLEGGQLGAKIVVITSAVLMLLAAWWIFSASFIG